MADTTTIPKGLGKLDTQDLIKTLFLAAATNILLGVYAIINAGGYPTHSDWQVMIKSTIAIVISNVIKALGTNNEGKLFAKDK
jgi:hypothetical protein